MRKFFSRNKYVFFATVFVFICGLLWGGATFNNEYKEVVASVTSLRVLLINNIVSMLLIASGFFTFGVSTVLYLVINGIVIGSSFVLALAKGKSLGGALLLIIPHGIFEIPAIIFSGMVGFKSIEIIVTSLRNNFKVSFFQKIQDTLVLLGFIIILVFLGGLVEIYVTPFFK